VHWEKGGLNNNLTIYNITIQNTRKSHVFVKNILMIYRKTVLFTEKVHS